MTPTKEQQAQEYAEKQLTDICLMLDYEENKQIGYFHTYDIQKAYSDGYTACEQSLWRRVEEEEPPIGKLILCRDTDRVALAYFDGEAITEAVFPNEDVTMPFWMPIPSLSDTNTEKI